MNKQTETNQNKNLATQKEEAQLLLKMQAETAGAELAKW